MKKWLKDGLIGWGAGAGFYILAVILSTIAAKEDFFYGSFLFAVCFSFLPSFLGGWFLGWITKKTWGSVVGGILPSALVWAVDFYFSNYILDLTQWQ